MYTHILLCRYSIVALLAASSGCLDGFFLKNQSFADNLVGIQVSSPYIQKHSLSLSLALSLPRPCARSCLPPPFPSVYLSLTPFFFLLSPPPHYLIACSLVLLYSFSLSHCLPLFLSFSFAQTVSLSLSPFLPLSLARARTPLSSLCLPIIQLRPSLHAKAKAESPCSSHPLSVSCANSFFICRNVCNYKQELINKTLQSCPAEVATLEK